MYKQMYSLFSPLDSEIVEKHWDKKKQFQYFPINFKEKKPISKVTIFHNYLWSVLYFKL